MTTAHKITEAEALSIMSDENAEFAPFRVLNKTGQQAVKDWLNRVAKKLQIPEAWYSEAEDAANNASRGESIIIEMRGFNTVSGNPETLTIEETGFDWMVNQ